MQQHLQQTSWLLSSLLIMALLCICATASAQNNRYAVLAYHDVIDQTGPIYRQIKTDPINNTNQIINQYYPQSISKKNLILHFNTLKTNGYNVISWNDVLEAQNGKKVLPEKAVLLTFDDGYESFYRIVYPLLKEYRYPAVLAVVTSILETPQNQLVTFGDTQISREAFVTWQQVQEMHQSGLVEIASHSHNLHRAIKANAQGSLFPAVFSAQYQNQQHETQQQYSQRLKQDFEHSRRLIAKHTGQFPDILVWPYGQFTDNAWQIAKSVGFGHQFTLHDEKLNPKDNPEEIGRFLVEEETLLETFSEYLQGKLRQSSIERIMHVDLDYVYDANAAQQTKNFDALIQRVHSSGATTVYLQAYADADGDGVAEKLYFPNRHLPVKQDLFSQVAWQLMTRAQVKVYAWLPVMAFDLGPQADYVKDIRTNAVNSEHYLRLNPYNSRNRQIIHEIYQDLSFHSKFHGLLFHDDVFLTDYEGPISGKREESILNQEADAKARFLNKLTEDLKQTVSQYSYRGNNKLLSARNIYAQVIINPKAKQWFAQDFQQFLHTYDRTAIMAMPYMEHEGNITSQEAQQWLDNLVTQANLAQNNHRVVFELQANNWRTKQRIPEQELNSWFDLLKQKGVYKFGYYPDDLIAGKPNLATIRPHFSLATGIRK